MSHIIAKLMLVRFRQSSAFSTGIGYCGDEIHGGERRGRRPGFAIDAAVEQQDFIADVGGCDGVADAAEDDGRDD